MSDYALRLIRPTDAAFKQVGLAQRNPTQYADRERIEQKPARQISQWPKPTSAQRLAKKFIEQET